MPDNILIAKEPTQDLHDQIPATRLVFIDPQVENYQSLVAGVLPNTSVVVLDADQDGIEQISQVLATHRQINSLHIVSHGAPGQVYLGNSQLSYATLNRYAWQLIGWANALSADAQLLLYGCEVGQTEPGKAFVQRLSELTGAVVAASDDLTGSTALGGDWELEVSTGAIVPTLAFQAEVMAAYASVLGLVVLDTSFNTTGKVTTDFNSKDDYGQSITVQADGKILVAGISNNGTNNDFAIVRYNRDGTLDTSFNTTGKVTTDFNSKDDFGYRIILYDGKILVGGYSYNGTNNDFAVVRYNIDGTLDTSFNTTGKVTTDFNTKNDYGQSITVQADGKILVGGYTDNGTNNDFAVVRYNSDGTLDTNFNATGKVTTDFNTKNDIGNSITVRPDGKILVAGISYNGTDYDFAVVRYNSNGTLDTSFNTTGKVTTDFNSDYDIGNSITVQTDGKILVAGYTDNGTNNDFAVARYFVNQASPVVANEIQDKEATEDSVFNFTIPVDTFSDADAGDILYYTATLANDSLLPTWLNFNPATLTFSGTPTSQDVGSLDIKVTAKDIAGDKASDVFTLAVDEKTDINIQSTSLLTKITGDIFSVKTKLNIKGDKAKLSIKIKTSNSKEVNELGVFFVDDEQGKINGIAPGAEGYTQAALSRSKVIFSALANLPNGFNTADVTNILEFDSDTKLRFYLVSNSTTQDVLSGKTSFSNVLFSSATNNNVEDEGFSLNFQNLVVNIQATEKQLTLGAGLQGKNQGELIDLRSQTQSVTANFAVNREASYNNYVGFYQVADENGGIDTNGDGKADILVGQAGYTQAAVRGRIAGIDLTVNNQGTANYTGTFQPGSIFAPFIIIDGRADAIVDSNANNDPKVYFSFLGANSDKVDHIRLLGNNTFGFEDLANGGDKDYNDVIVRVNLSVDVAN